MHKEQVTLKELNTGRIIINYQFLLLLCAALTWLILHILGNYVYSSSKERDRVKKKGGILSGNLHSQLSHTEIILAISYRYALWQIMNVIIHGHGNDKVWPQWQIIWNYY